MSRIRSLFRTVMAGAALSLAALAAPAMGEEDVPYWVSLRADEANMRVGPSESYPIEWVYQRKGLPMRVVRKLSGWRLVEDPDGTRGWIVSRFLSLERAAIVTGKDPAPMRAQADADAKVLWRAEPGVSGWLGDCRNGYCRFAVGERAGWIAQKRLWGVGKP
ncbi:MAG TPA: SH3 domain-containing protein [Croceicoccus sp.]|nr:SH3 domain-containing protein [Croceicoccus sp.]